jgi:hypothetical protein
MAGLVPAIHVLSQSVPDKKTWMPRISSAKTRFALLPGHDGNVSPPFHRSRHPACHFASCQKVQRRAPHLGRIAPAVRDRNEEIAAARNRNAKSSVARAIGHIEIVGPDPSGHIGDPDDIARRDRREPRAQQIEIGDAIDLIIVGDAAIAVAEADLGPHVHFDVATAGGCAATERFSRGPAVARERPGDLVPRAIPFALLLFVLARRGMLIGRSA